MKRRLSFRLVPAALLLLALAAPASFAASVDCCPQSEARAAIVAPPVCCGQCTPKLERSNDMAPLAAKALAASQVLGLSASASTRVARVAILSFEAPGLLWPPGSPPSAPAPLRL